MTSTEPSADEVAAGAAIYSRVEAALKSKSKARLRTALRKLEATPGPGDSDDSGDRTFREECPSG